MNPPLSIICINQGCGRVFTTRSNRFTCSLECAAAITQLKEAKRKRRALQDYRNSVTRRWAAREKEKATHAA